MASDPQIKVRISAKADELSASLAQVRKDLASLPTLAAQVNRKLDGGGGGRGFRGLEQQAGRFAGAARGGLGSGLGAFGAVTRTVPGLGALAGAASIAGIGEMLSRFASGGIELQNTARLAGTTSAGLNSLRGAARQVGLSAGDADQAMLGLQHTLADAAFGRNSEAAQQFQRLGIDFGSITRGARSAEQVLPQVVDQLTLLYRRNPNAAERLAQIWGIPASALPLLVRGRDALAENRREIEALYGSMDAYEQSSSRFTRQTATLSLAAEKLGVTILNSVEPHLTPLLGQLSRFVSEHDQDIGQAFDRMGLALSKTDWGKVGQGIDGVGRALSFATQNADLMARGLETLAGTTIIRAILGNTPLGRFVTAGFLAYEAAGLVPWGRMVGTPEEQVNRYGEEYHRIMPPGADNRSWWERNAPSWLGGSPAPAPRRLPGGPMGGFENGAQSTTRATEASLSPEARGLLDTIAGTESPGYDRLYGGSRFTGYGEHPGIPVPITTGPNAGRSSTAAGRYQMLYRTWLEARDALNLPDFSPQSQDRAAWWLAQRDYRTRTGRDLSADLRSTDPGIRANIGAALSGTWTSLPGGIEATTNQNRFTSALDRNTRREQQTTSVSDPPPTPVERFRLPMPNDPSTWPKPQADNNGASTVRIEIDHSNVPESVSMNASTKGDTAEIAGIRVRRAMPQSGLVPAFGGT